MRFLRNFIILLSCLFLTTKIFSQQVIKGTVKDSATKEPIVFAVLKFLNVNDSLIFYVYSDDNGTFTLPYMANIESKITAEMLSYEKYEKTLGKLTKNMNYNETILLIPSSQLLGEVEIRDSSSQVIRKIDRTIVNIQNEQIKTSHNIYDILKTLPGVYVDESTNIIRFKGSTPDILINNLNAEYIYPDLNAINISQIKSIELINKSSIYGGAGEDGIINIKLKQEKQKKIGAYLGMRHKYDIMDGVFVPEDNLINLNFSFGKITIINNLGLYGNYNQNRSEGTGNLKINDIYYNRGFENSEKWKQHQIWDALGIMIPIGKVQLLIADQIQYAKSNLVSTFYQNTYIDSSYYNKTSQKSEHDINHFMNKFSAQLSANNYYNQDINLSFTMFHFNPPSPFVSKMNNFSETLQSNSIYNDTIFQQETHSHKIIYLFGDLQYKYNISQTSYLGLFGHYINAFIPIDKKMFLIDGVDYKQLDSDAKFKMLCFSGGVSYAKVIQRFSIDATFGYKFQQIVGDFIRNVNSSDTTINLNLKYPNIEPSIRLQYRIDNLNSLSLGYSYSAGNLDFNDISTRTRKYIPYVDKTDPLNWISGNQNLTMEKYNKIYFQYNYIADSLSFSAELFYSLTNNAITDVKIPINAETTLSQPENMAFNDRIGADLNFWYQLSKRWAFSINTQLYHYRFKDNSKDIISEFYEISTEEINQKSFGASAQIFLRYNLKSKIGSNPNVRFWINYNSKEITFTGYDKQYFNANIVFRSNFFKNKVYISLGLENLLSPFIHKQTIYNYLDMKTKTNYYSYRDNMRISLSLGWCLFAGDRDTKDFKL